MRPSPLFSVAAAALVVIGLGIAVAHATPTTEIAIESHAVSSVTIAGGQPDVLGLDLTIRAPRGDILDALFVKQEGTAQWQRDLADAVLWVDRGVTGFQGIGVDRKAATGAWVASENGWAFDRVFEQVAAEGTRFFITVSTVAQPTNQATVWLRIPGYRDGFSPMSYDRGDLGVFLRTARPAPLAPITSAALHTINRKTVDDLAPVVRLTEPEDGASLASDWLIVRGIAADLGGSVPSRVRVGVNRPGRAISWVDAAPEVGGFATWEARFFELPRPVTLELRVQGEDWAGNRSSVSEPVTVTLTE